MVREVNEGGQSELSVHEERPRQGHSDGPPEVFGSELVGGEDTRIVRKSVLAKPGVVFVHVSAEARNSLHKLTFMSAAVFDDRSINEQPTANTNLQYDTDGPFEIVNACRNSCVTNARAASRLRAYGHRSRIMQAQGTLE